MQEQYINPLKELDYATLSKEQENTLRNAEKQFNTDFGTNLYFMVMKKDKL